MDLNYRGTPYAILNDGTAGEIWVTDDRLDRDYASFRHWLFHQGDELVLQVSKDAVGEEPSTALLLALLDARADGYHAGERQGFRDGRAALQRTLRKALGMPAPEDDAPAMLELVKAGYVSRDQAATALRMTV